MDDKQVIILEDELNRPVSELTRKFYNDILNAMDARAKQAKMQLDEVQAMLVELAGIVNPDWMFEQRVTKMRDIQKIKIDELVPVVKKAAKEAHIAMLKAKTALTDTSNLKAEIERLRQELASAVAEKEFHQNAAERSQVSIDQMKKKLNELVSKNSVDREDRVIVQAMVSEEFDDGIKAFEASRRRDRLEFLIECVGERGETLSPDLARAIAEKYNISDPRSRAVVDLVAEADSLWLISQSEATLNRPGQPPKMVKLTPMGELLYEKLFSKPPRKVDHVKEHKTVPHASLITRAEELLRQIGYEILGSVEIKEGNAHTFQPDITARKDGRTIYVEVERNTTKDNQDFKAKMQNFRNFTNGQMYIFCENNQHIQDVVRELRSGYIGQGGDKVRFCSLANTAKGVKHESELWNKVLDI